MTLSGANAFRLKPSRTLSIARVCIPAKKLQLATERVLLTSAAKPNRLPNSAVTKASKEFDVTAQQQVSGLFPIRPSRILSVRNFPTTTAKEIKGIAKAQKMRARPACE